MFGTDIITIFVPTYKQKYIMARFLTFSIIVKNITEYEKVSETLIEMNFKNDERWNNKRKTLINTDQFLDKRFYVEVNGDTFTLFSQSLSADDSLHFKNLEKFIKSDNYIKNL